MNMNIYEKLLQVRKACTYLQKQRPKDAMFGYVSSSQVIMAIREKMDEVGLLLIPNIIGMVFHKMDEIGGKRHLTEIITTMTWVNASNPDEKIECTWGAQGTDSGELGIGKAVTYNEKTFILKFFNIATDKWDPDAVDTRKRKQQDKNPPDKKTEVENNLATEDQKKALIAKAEQKNGLSAKEVTEVVLWYTKGEALTKEQASTLNTDWAKQFDLFLDNKEKEKEKEVAEDG